MDEKYVELIAELADHLAWPITLILLVIVFKKQLQKLIDNLRKIVWGNKSAHFDELASDPKTSNELENALKDAKIKGLHNLVQQPELRLLLALAGTNERLPLTIYRAPRYESAKINIIRKGLATFQNGKFKITDLGLKVVSLQVESRIDLNKNLSN